jgi:hypothetical protein
MSMEILTRLDITNIDGVRFVRLQETVLKIKRSGANLISEILKASLGMDGKYVNYVVESFEFTQDAISKHILDFPVPSLPERNTTPCSCKNCIAFSTADVLTYVLSCLCCDISLYVFSEIKKNSTNVLIYNFPKI